MQIIQQLTSHFGGCQSFRVYGLVLMLDRSCRAFVAISPSSRAIEARRKCNAGQVASGKDVQSTRLWSLIMIAKASGRFAARKAGPMSLEKTLAWKAKKKGLANS
jgi:hypothetical protein